MSKFTEPDSIETYNLERNKALTELDMEWMASFMVASGVDNPDPEAILLAAHRARYHILGIGEEHRHASAKWLRDNGYTDLHGMPLLPEGQLPS